MRQRCDLKSDLTIVEFEREGRFCNIDNTGVTEGELDALKFSISRIFKQISFSSCWNFYS